MDYKHLYKELERILGQIEAGDDIAGTLQLMATGLVDNLSGELGILGGRIYAKEGTTYVVTQVFGESTKDSVGIHVPEDYAPVHKLQQMGTIYMGQGDRGFDSRIENNLGVEVFAALMVGEHNEFMMAFSLKPEHEPTHILYALSAARQVFSLKVQQIKMQDIMEKARDIQLTTLPSGAPEFPGFEIGVKSVPHDLVGGDLYDWLPFGEGVLGMAIADVSGHGLPAALQARDVITGLRMGTEEHLKITHTIAKLNRVIYRSKLTSKFVSLFYGEVEKNGNFIYCNAGHFPPLVFMPNKDDFEELVLGGPILGPNPSAQYARGYFRFRKGDIMALYTDGILERMDSEGTEFGLARLKEAMRRHRDLSAQEMVEAIFRDVQAFGGEVPQQDDTTLIIVKSQVE